MGTLAMIAALTLLNALFVGIEFAMVAARRPRIEAMAGSGSRPARVLLPHISEPIALDRIVSAGQIGITASSLLLGAFGQGNLVDRLAPAVVASGLPEPLAISLTTAGVLLVLTVVQVLFGELVPKAVAMRYPEQTALALVYPATGFLRLMRVGVDALCAVGRMFLGLLRVPLEYHRHVHSSEDIEVLINQGREKGVLDAAEHKRLQRVLRFSDLRVREVMVPRTRIRAVVESASREAIEREVAETPYTRLPVYRESLDDIVGLLHVKDVFIAMAEGRAPEVRSLLRELPRVPASMNLHEVFDRLRAQGAQMAVVMDEFGGTAGIVTVEDLVEEVMGEVQDEFDSEAPPFEAVAPGVTRVRGDRSLGDVSEHLECALSDEDVHTVAGLVMKHLGRPPRRGDRVHVDDLVLEVEEVTGTTVGTLRIARASQIAPTSPAPADLPGPADPSAPADPPGPADPPVPPEARHD